MSTKVLIVEDETVLSNALKIKLQKEGFDVSEASNGVEGLAAVKKDIPDIILTDLLMPIMSGTQLLDELSKNKETAEIPVIVLTNLADDESMLSLMKTGKYDFLVKSDWSLEDVVKKIREKLSQK